MYSDITQFFDKEFTFTKHIKESKYIQSYNKDRTNSKFRYKSLIECIIGENDPMIQVIPNKQKLISIKQKIIELCSLLFENQEEYYYKYKFNEKIMKPKLISQALQSNYLSAIYYLNEYYQTHFVIIINNKYYPTSSKSYPKQYILHNQDNNQMISINSEVKVYENLDKNSNDRYEFILPKLNLIKRFESPSSLDGNFLIKSSLPSTFLIFFNELIICV